MFEVKLNYLKIYAFNILNIKAQSFISEFSALIASLAVYWTIIRYKNAAQRNDFSKNQKNIYQIEKGDSKFIYGVNDLNKHCFILTLRNHD